jgi:trehalose synthase
MSLGTTETAWQDSVRRFIEVPIEPEGLDCFSTVLAPDDYTELLNMAARAQGLLGGRTIWNITSTARGGGVAEMLTSLLPLARGAGVNVRWLAIQAELEFFQLTKRIHNRLHGSPGDNGALGAQEHALYEGVLFHLAERLLDLVSPGEIVILHDPQTAGLAPPLLRKGAIVIWRCHIGIDTPNALVRSAWEFLRTYLQHADAYIYSRAAYVDEGLDPRRVAIIPPSIDVFSAKNQQLRPAQVSGILAATQLVNGPAGDATFERLRGGIDVVTRPSELCGSAPVPERARIVTQISRWDRLKDPVGVMMGFVEHVCPKSDAHLVLAGPQVAMVADDPEGFEVLLEARAIWGHLPPLARERVHLACLPMDDTEENAAIVNALQRRASIVVQKSLAEGFGLTVAEAMWKERAIVASRVGGIQDQIADGVTGLLVDPTNLADYGSAVVALLSDSSLAHRLGSAAHQKCRDEYLGSRHLIRYVTFLESLLRQKRAGASGHAQTI